jgi:large conductance mechanosensitive channel
MASEFKQFVLRGNVVDLAVAVVIGVAFAAVVTSLVEDIVTPLFEINDSVFRYGSFINAVLSFVLIAAAVFFVLVKPVNTMIARSRSEPPADPTTQKCPQCLSEIPLEASRCAFCAQPVAVG